MSALISRFISRTRSVACAVALVALGAAAARAADAPVAEVASDDQPTWEPHVRATLGGGYDDNVRYLPPGALDTRAGQADPPAASAFASLGLALAVEGTPTDRVRVELGYELYQIVYTDRALADYAYQEHALALRLGRADRGFFGWELGLRADLGLSGFATRVTPFQRSASVDPELTIGRGGPVQLRLAGQALFIETLDPELTFLSGTRLEARAVPVLELARWRVSLPVRYRRDWLGTSEGELIPDGDPEACAACGSRQVVAYDNHSVSGGLRVSAPFSWRLRPGLFARVERRVYLARPVEEITFADGSRSRRFEAGRGDDRLVAGASLALALGELWSLTARYDVSASRAVDAAPRGYRKQTFALELELDWM